MSTQPASLLSDIHPRSVAVDLDGYSLPRVTRTMDTSTGTNADAENPVSTLSTDVGVDGDGDGDGGREVTPHPPSAQTEQNPISTQAEPHQPSTQEEQHQPPLEPTSPIKVEEPEPIFAQRVQPKPVHSDNDVQSESGIQQQQQQQEKQQSEPIFRPGHHRQPPATHTGYTQSFASSSLGTPLGQMRAASTLPIRQMASRQQYLQFLQHQQQLLNAYMDRGTNEGNIAATSNRSAAGQANMFTAMNRGYNPYVYPSTPTLMGQNHMMAPRHPTYPTRGQFSAPAPAHAISDLPENGSEVKKRKRYTVIESDEEYEKSSTDDDSGSEDTPISSKASGPEERPTSSDQQNASNETEGFEAVQGSVSEGSDGETSGETPVKKKAPSQDGLGGNDSYEGLLKTPVRPVQKLQIENEDGNETMLEDEIGDSDDSDDSDDEPLWKRRQNRLAGKPPAEDDSIEDQPEDLADGHQPCVDIDWKIAAYEVIELPVAKNDPREIAVSIPGCIREKLILSQDFASQELLLFREVFLPNQKALEVPDAYPATAILNFHNICNMVLDSYYNHQMGDVSGFDLASDPQQDADEIDEGEVFFESAARWRTGLAKEGPNLRNQEVLKPAYTHIRGPQEFSEIALDIIYYIKEHGALPPESEESERPKKRAKPAKAGDQPRSRSELGKTEIKQASRATTEQKPAKSTPRVVKKAVDGTKSNPRQLPTRKKAKTSPKSKYGSISVRK
ncbi:unnamed protein product [Periconia digitata]|uniref:Uncharacterized protein n=1 Tax=Periconia digitata TaxID=1303443 RepID=A0A9W4U5Y1_9PLEO|nr:unnamed protein product [Periconia digitata]